MSGADRGRERQETGEQSAEQLLEEAQTARDAFRCDPKNWDKVDPTNFPERARYAGRSEAWTAEELAAIADFDPSDEEERSDSIRFFANLDRSERTDGLDQDTAALGRANDDNRADTGDSGGHSTGAGLQPRFESAVVDWAREKMRLGDRPNEPSEITRIVDRPRMPLTRPAEWSERKCIDSDGNERPLPLWNGSPKRTDVEQGRLGDCWLMVGLGAAAHHAPEAVANAVRERADGSYSVTLHQVRQRGLARDFVPDGDRTINLRVTPELPSTPGKPDVAVGAETSKTQVAWPAIVEKAYAGVEQTWDDKRSARRDAECGPNVSGYDRLNRGGHERDMAEALAQLTGRRCGARELDPNRPQAAVETMRQHLSENKPFLIGTRDERDVYERLPHGLQGGHAYEVTSIDDAGNVSLRNPWARRHPQPMPVQDLLHNTDCRYVTFTD